MKSRRDWLPRRINRIRRIRLVCKGCGELIAERRKWIPQPIRDFLEEYPNCPHCGRVLQVPRVKDIKIEGDNDEV